MKANDLDKKFDDNKDDVLDNFDLETASRPNRALIVGKSV